MKLLTSFLLVLFCGLLTGNPGSPNSASNGGAPNSPKAESGGAVQQTGLQCNRDILWSYKLKGRSKASSEEKFILCPAVKDSCCNKIDQQKIFHIVNDILPPRHLAYRTKVEQAIGRLRRLHIKIRKAIFAFPGTMERRKWCTVQQRKVINYPYKQFFSKLTRAIELSAHDNLEHYQSFYCILCDAKNHPFINTSKGQTKVTLDLGYCRSFLDKRSHEIRMLNIELIEYMKMIQGVVDCVHYTKSFNLNFFDASRNVFSQQVDSCLKSLNSPEFQKDCKPLCDQMSISDIIPVAEGDSVFLTNAINLFERFFEYQEQGKFISMKLRLFFQRFHIPKTMTSRRRAKFLETIEKKIPKKKMKETVMIKPPPPAISAQKQFLNQNPELSEDSPYAPFMEGDLSSLIHEEEEEDSSEDQATKNKRHAGKWGNEKPKKNEETDPNPDYLGNGQLKEDTEFREDASVNGALTKKVARELSMADSYNPEVESMLFGNFYRPTDTNHQLIDNGASESFPIAEDDSWNKKSDSRNYRSSGYHLGNGRKLQAVQGNSNPQPNSPQNTPNQQQGNSLSTNNTGNTAQNPRRRKRTASLVFDKDLYKFYDEITVRKVGKKQQTIFKTKPDPINLTKATKIFAVDSGINPELYAEKRFGLPKALFYKELFSFREIDKRDSNLLFMLADFNKDYQKAANIALKTDYVIKPTDFEFKFTRVVPGKKPEPYEKPLITWESLQSKPGKANAYDTEANKDPSIATNNSGNNAGATGNGSSQSGTQPSSPSSTTSRRKK